MYPAAVRQQAAPAGAQRTVLAGFRQIIRRGERTEHPARREEEGAPPAVAPVVALTRRPSAS